MHIVKNNAALAQLASECEKELGAVFAEIDQTAYKNTEKVMRVFATNQLSERHFATTSGYGYNDDGRDMCDRLFAQVFGCESGFARHNIISGTHAIAIALFGLLRPNDTLYSVTGKPYDTLDNVIGLSGANGDGSLADFGVKYRQTELIDGKTLDYEAIKNTLISDKSIKVVFAQRSKGYLSRRSLPSSEINALYELVKQYSGAYLVVDNCYGEFCEETEPKADILVGSLIKNPGGGIAETGGYIVGTKKAVELASYRLTVPGIGLEAGASLGQTKNMIKGLFFAPHATAQALKTAVFAALLFEKLGYDVSPTAFEKRVDIIQTVNLKNADTLLKFCRGIQAGSPIDSFVEPVGWAMPGYNDEVVMAAGTFTQGSSIELSADAPIREPYTVYLQGGVTYESGKYGILSAARYMLDLM
ncbi:MAG TPA: methionine gamma-lyase family protein [Bacillota bacterium]|nr:methionine gamma-lyase family protein [Bacillota bacterium]HOK68323.1 methionine gamma-lyase family protein [Bacillota bacterium]HPP85233.1 methionine gamma-lyase family protein [Bacillota bacterium]